MDISIIQDNEIEDELKVNLCCKTCATNDYGWTEAQFDFIYGKLKKGEAIEVSSSVSTPAKFTEFVKNNIKA